MPMFGPYFFETEASMCVTILHSTLTMCSEPLVLVLLVIIILMHNVRRCAATAIHMTFVWVLAEPVLPEYDLIFDEKLHPLTSQRVSSTHQTRVCAPA